MSEFLTIDTGEVLKTTPKQILPLPIYGDDYPLLKVALPEIQDVSAEEVRDVAERLKLTMKMYNGLGLSANQCGVSMRMFVIGTDQFQMTCINPKIVGFSEDIARKREGCLSYPGLFITIPRHTSIQVEYVDEFGQKQEITMDGVTAQCFQHELDHLNGITFTSKVGSAALQLAKQKQQKLIKKITRAQKKHGIRI
jgi:peptide deformylase